MNMFTKERFIYLLGKKKGIEKVEKLLESELYKADRDNQIIEAYTIADLLILVREMKEKK